MDSEIKEKYIKAGKITAQVREESKQIVKEGAPLAEIADKLEQRIRELGGEVAFPACLSINEIAAHASPGFPVNTTKNGKDIVPEGCLIKVDVGAHVDGYIGDTAVTLDFSGENQKLIDAAKAGLAAAIEQCYTGNEVQNVSAAIENAIREFDFSPISNLTGHGLAHYFLHESPSIPNVKNNSTYKLREGQVFAIEPFATPGEGFVKDAEQVTIFRIAEQKPVRNQGARKIISYASSINGLPFSERWLPLDSLFKIRMAFRELRERDMLIEYPALREVSGALISQAEHTVIIDDKPVVTTKYP